MRIRRLPVVVLAGTAMLVSGLSVPAQAVQPGATKTYKACANKKSGAIRLVVKGRTCTKREIRLKWNVRGPAGLQGPVGPQGPQGPQGVPGPALQVRDGNGTALGQFQTVTQGLDATWYVLFEGGSYAYRNYLETGQDRRVPTGTVFYLNASCTGTPYDMVLAGFPDVAAGGPTRLLRTFTDGSAEAFAFSGAASTTLAVNTPAWVKTPAKACAGAPALPAGNKILPLTPVTAPPFAVGTIQIG